MSSKPLHLAEYAALNATDSGSRKITSANLSVVDEGTASPEVAELYAHFRSHFGRESVPGILQCFATHPPLLKHMMALSETMLFSEGALGRQQKELIATFVSARNECQYCADSHGFFFCMHGGSRDVLHAALAGDSFSPVLSDPQKALLGFARKVSDNSASVNPADIDELRAHGWNDLQIAEVIHVTALFATFNRVVNAFGLSSQHLLTTSESDVVDHSENKNI